MKDYHAYNIYYGYITRFNPEKYTVDVAIFPGGKVITNVPVAYLNSFHAYGVTVVPAPNQEVLVIDFVNGGTVVLPVMTKKYNDTYQGARPNEFESGDVYITTPKTRFFNFASGTVVLETGPLNAATASLTMRHDQERERGVTLLETDVLAITTPSTLVEFGQMQQNETDKVFRILHDANGRKTEIRITPDGILEVAIKDTTGSSSILFSREQLTLKTLNTVVTVADSVAVNMADGSKLEIEQNGTVKLNAKAFEIDASTVNIRTNNFNLRTSNSYIASNNLVLETSTSSFSGNTATVKYQTATVDVPNIMVLGKVSIEGGLTARSKVECFGELLLNSDAVITRRPTQLALDSLYSTLLTVSNAYNAHTHTVVAGTATVTPLPPVQQLPPRPQL